jgi:hypothetical protein
MKIDGHSRSYRIFKAAKNETRVEITSVKIVLQVLINTD